MVKAIRTYYDIKTFYPLGVASDYFKKIITTKEWAGLYPEIEFNAICPHLQFNLLNTDGDKNSLVCPGHGLKFNLKNGVSSCKKFKIKVFNVINENGYYYLKT